MKLDFSGGERPREPKRTLVSSLAPPIVDVSCLSGQGIEALKDAIKNLVWAGKIEAGMLQVMINSRHQEALGRAREATLRTLDALRADATLELVALDLRIAVNAVGEIVGKDNDGRFARFHLQPVLHRQIISSAAARLYFNDAMSMTKRYFTSFFTRRS